MQPPAKDELRQAIVRVLDRLVADGTAFGQYHRRAQVELAVLAEDFGLHGVVEYRLPAKQLSRLTNQGKKRVRRTRRGQIDVAWLRGDDPVAAIEIDNNARIKSIEKLVDSGAQIQVWVYIGPHHDKAINMLAKHPGSSLMEIMVIPYQVR